MELEDVIEEYIYYCLAKGFTKKTLINKKQELKNLKLYLKEKRGISQLQNIHLDDLRAYIRFKYQSGLQPQSVVSMYKMVSAFFNWCVREGYSEENLMKKVETSKVPKKVLKGFNVDDIYSMIEAFSYKSYQEARNKAIIAMLADCGLRAMEIRTLPYENVGETSILVYGKGNKERTAYISPALKKVLVKYERIRREYVKDKILKEDTYFLSYQGRGLSHVSLDKVIKEAGGRAGVKGKRISPHTFRHYFALTLLMNGIDIYSLSRLLGHTSILTTQRYLESLTDETCSFIC
ncbi:tyrosine-type recombinase/integrase [Domibacillus indicus]|uniref:tyrosine-type recombinase/integrase n=1 Tax=Domibacillus indicus TaxID=1437523 RepID=UPI00203E82D3|nr:tyrosine-type recombinase/integrase [Domibacillus indicus]MCM3790730.1 tyrosine-type recombinase/integrase [Domibacillus indicus]